MPSGRCIFDPAVLGRVVDRRSILGGKKVVRAGVFANQLANAGRSPLGSTASGAPFRVTVCGNSAGRLALAVRPRFLSVKKRSDTAAIPTTTEATSEPAWGGLGELLLAGSGGFHGTIFQAGQLRIGWRQFERPIAADQLVAKIRPP